MCDRLLFDQVLTFRVSRQSALLTMGWQSISPERGAQIEAAMKDHCRAILATFGVSTTAIEWR